MNESTLVPREEMSDLDWLARNVHVWNELAIYLAKSHKDGFSHEWYFSGVKVREDMVLTKCQWLSRRAELQNKPSWKDAPDWAEFLSQSVGGAWYWHEFKPSKGTCLFFNEGGKHMMHCEGEALGDWRDTLERRPEIDPEISYNLNFESFMPFVSVEDIGTVSETAGQQYRREIREIAVNKFNDAMKDAATAKQPTPKGSGNPILGMVLADLTNRALEGKDKYGEPLLAHNGRNPLWDAYQEALDLAMYLRQAIEEQK